MISEYAQFAQRAHGDLTLPDATGKPLHLRGLFDQPLELMAGLIRGGWIIPFSPDRSMFLTSIIGTGSNRGPSLLDEDIKLLSDWIAAGAVLPNVPPKST